MYTVYIYNNESNRLERYKLKPYHDMPYTYANALSVSEFFANTISLVGWTSTDFLKLWTSFSKGEYHKAYFFRRIFEGGHIQQSMHYAGIAARLTNRDRTPFPFSFENHVSLISCGYPKLSLGDIGIFVFVIQDALMNLGYVRGELDGFFGELTERELIAFKHDHNLPLSPVCDSHTMHKLTLLAAGNGVTTTTKYVNLL